MEKNWYCKADTLGDVIELGKIADALSDKKPRPLGEGGSVVGVVDGRMTIRKGVYDFPPDCTAYTLEQVCSFAYGKPDGEAWDGTGFPAIGSIVKDGKKTPMVIGYINGDVILSDGVSEYYTSLLYLSPVGKAEE